ncbi:hypothetical protein XFF6166_90003 [Xanthomonas citri pv. fuscans]|nr:hypothetical protein XFF6166_90003 [Xanthomonas citri pv. fuscans]
MPLYRTKSLTGANDAGKIVLKFATPNKKYRYKNRDAVHIPLGVRGRVQSKRARPEGRALDTGGINFLNTTCSVRKSLLKLKTSPVRRSAGGVFEIGCLANSRKSIALFKRVSIHQS